MGLKRRFVGRGVWPALVFTALIAGCGGAPEAFSGTGFTAEVPSDWEPLEDAEAAERFGLDEDPGVELVASWRLDGQDVSEGSIGVLRSRVRPGDSAQDVLRFGRASLEVAVVTNDERTELDGAPARTFDFSGGSPASGSESVAVIAVEGRHAYVVNFNASSLPAYGEFRPEFEAMLDSWRWQSAPDEAPLAAVPVLGLPRD